MRKLIVFNLISLDGYFADKNSGIDWHVVDDEFNRAAVEMIKEFDTILFGRITYDLFESYWPGAAKDPAVSPDDKFIADRINDMRKVVATRTRQDLTWHNSKLLEGDLGNAVRQLKAAPGKHIVIYGSGTIVQQLTNLGLIDEYRLMVGPVILGEGKPMFANVTDTHKLRRTGVRPFSSGNVLLTYTV